MRMKAAFLTGKEKIELRDIPKPSPDGGEALVRVANVGICGSDVHYFLKGRIGDQVVEYPFIIGHEAAGIVEKAGKGVNGLKEGDRVAIEPGIPCGKCGVCLRGKPNLCRGVKFLGTPPVPGAFREYMVMPEENLMVLPEGVDTEEGALCEPLAVGLYAVMNARPAPGDAVAVFGCGPIGISVLICSVLAGAGKVFAVEKIKERVEFAKTIGADAVINPGEADPVREIMRLSGGGGVDVAYEAAGEIETLIQCVDSAALLGKVVIVGIPEQDCWEVPSHPSRKKELTLYNVRRSAFTPAKTLSLLGNGRISVKGMVTHRFPLEEIEKALKLVAGYSDGVIKAMVEI